MTDSEFEVGDTVQLRSGGPVMTVEALREDDVLCCFFDEHDVFTNVLLPDATLDLVEFAEE